MITELGHLALILAFGAALVQMVIPMIGAQKNWSDWMAVATPAANVQFVLTSFAFAVLMYAFIVSDFSVQLVAVESARPRGAGLDCGGFFRFSFVHVEPVHSPAKSSFKRQ